MSIIKIASDLEMYQQKLEHDQLPAVDPILFEIICNRLRAIANEMGATVHSTAHTSVFAETKDFSCALFDHEGHMVGMGEFLPTHQGGMQNTLDGVIKEIGLENLKNGDVIMTNDALYGACHPPDLTLFKPIFVQDELIGIAGIIVHHIDMGGMTPSSYCPKATELYQEGLRFPPTTKLIEGGELRQDILNIFLTNVRMPDAQYGDLMAQVAGCNTAAMRLTEIANKYGVKTFKDVCIAIQYYAANRVKEFIRQLPDGVYEAEDYVDGDGVTERSYRIHCALTVADDKMVFDFSNSDSQATGFVNSRWGNTSASAMAAIMAHIPTDIPKTFGTFVPIHMIARKGTIVNPMPTAPIGACTTESGYIISNVVQLCLGQANPAIASGVWGGNFGTHIIWGNSPRTGKYFVTILESAGGMGGGARATMDGWPVASLRGSNVTLPNVEIEESVLPIIYLNRRLPRDDEYGGGGQGEFRAGPGCSYEVSPDGCTIDTTIILGRFKHRAAGVFGGRDGHLAKVKIKDKASGQVVREIANKTVGEKLNEDEIMCVAVAGGGGYGAPESRPPEQVRKDVIDGYTSWEAALNIYQVAINQEDLSINWEETGRLRRINK